MVCEFASNSSSQHMADCLSQLPYISGTPLHHSYMRVKFFNLMSITAKILTKLTTKADTLSEYSGSKLK